MNSDTNTAPQSHAAVNILAATLFLVPAVGVPNEYVLQDTLKSAIGASGILTALVAWMWAQRIHATPTKWHWVVLLPLALCVHALWSMGWSHAYLGAVEAIRWFLVAIAIMVVHNTVHASGVRRLLWGLHGGMAVAALWVALQFWFGLQVFPQVAAPASTFINRNFYAEAAVSTLPFSLLLLFDCKRSSSALAVSASMALIVTSILMTGTRSALLTMPALLFVLSLMSWKFRKQLAVSQWPRRGLASVVVCFVLGVVTMGGVTTPDPESGSPRSAFGVGKTRSGSALAVATGADPSVSVRYEMWTSALRMVATHPWRGVGAGAFEVHAVRYQDRGNDDEIDPHAHNEYLQLLAEYGLLVGGGVLTLLIALVIHAAQDASRGGPSTTASASLSVATIGSLWALGLVSLVGFPMHLANGTLLLAVSLGLLAQRSRQTIETTLNQRWAAWLLGVAAGALAACMALVLVAMYVETQYARALRGLNANTHATPQESTQLASALYWNPHYRKLQIPLVTRLVVMQEWALATTVLEAMVSSRPYAANAWFSLAMLYAKQNRLELAQAALDRLQQIQPNAVRNYKVLAEILYRQGKGPEALGMLDSLIARWPTGQPPDPGLLQLRADLQNRTAK